VLKKLYDKNPFKTGINKESGNGAPKYVCDGIQML
jgi:hypothetical protein